MRATIHSSQPLQGASYRNDSRCSILSRCGQEDECFFSPPAPSLDLQFHPRRSNVVFPLLRSHVRELLWLACVAKIISVLFTSTSTNRIKALIQVQTTKHTGPFSCPPQLLHKTVDGRGKPRLPGVIILSSLYFTEQVSFWKKQDTALTHRSSPLMESLVRKERQALKRRVLQLYLKELNLFGIRLRESMPKGIVKNNGVLGWKKLRSSHNSTILVAASKKWNSNQFNRESLAKNTAKKSPHGITVNPGG